jgi:uncharacterized RDD family membrane protein YckC
MLAPNGRPLASFGQRLAARLIDGLVLSPLVLLVFVAMGFAFAMIAPTETDAVGSGSTDAGTFGLMILGVYIVAIVLMLVVQYVYEVELTKRTGQTIGKKVMKLWVVPLDPTQRVDRSVMAKRWVTTVGVGVLPAGSLMDGLWQLWDQPYQQCLHDKWPRTVVIAPAS